MQLTIIAKLLGIAAVLLVINLYFLERSEREGLEKANALLVAQRDSLSEQAKGQQAKIQSFNKLSVQQAEEAKHAQNEIDRLNDELRTGAKRVYIKASCPTVSDASGTRSLGDGGAAKLSDSAREDYIRLRRLMVQSQMQTQYLQEYIKTQCLSLGPS
ncbi:lysis protein [Vibrio diazotrophicus]|nr:lysis protein [Vibrio diazotrophicus]